VDVKPIVMNEHVLAVNMDLIFQKCVMSVKEYHFGLEQENDLVGIL